MVFSREVKRAQFADWPPYVDGCPRCVSINGCVPYATETSGTDVVAFYRHRGCGHQWSCRWARSSARVA